MFFDRAFLLLSNILFFVGLIILVGINETIMFFMRKIKGAIALFIGFIFIIIGLKLVGVVFQVYGIYQFFKAYALSFLGYFEWIPYIGKYIRKFRGLESKKNDDVNIV